MFKDRYKRVIENLAWKQRPINLYEQKENFIQWMPYAKLNLSQNILDRNLKI